MKTSLASILVAPNGGELCDNRIHDDKMEEVKALASILPTIRIFR